MQSPKDMLIYYGWLNSLNSARNGWSNEKVSQNFSQYDQLVFGNGLQDPTHGDYVNTQLILPMIKALNPDVKIYGYVTVNQDLTAFTLKVDQWVALPIDGIFMDEAGYDYGKNRAEFNQRVDYIHGKSKCCIANAWNPDNVLGIVNDVSFPNTTYNPSLIASNLNASDSILLESFPVNTVAYSGGIESASDWKIRGDKAVSLYNQFGVEFISSSVIDNASSNGEFLCAFAYAASQMFGLKVFGTSDVNYGAISAAVRFWPRPKTLNSVSSSVFQDTSNTDIYHCYMGDEHLSLKFTANQQAAVLEDRVSVYGSLYAANVTTSQAITAAASKLTLWSAAGLSNRMTVDLANKKIIILVPGVYEVSFDACASVAASNNVQFHLRKNGVELPEFGTKVKLPTTLAAAGFSNLVNLVAGDYLEIFVDGTSNTNLSIYDAHLIARKI